MRCFVREKIGLETYGVNLVSASAEDDADELCSSVGRLHSVKR
jgi:hypothetical protein